MRNKTTTTFFESSTTTGSLIDVSCLIPPGTSPTKAVMPGAFVTFDLWMDRIDGHPDAWEALTFDRCAVPLDAEETAFEIKGGQA